MNEKAKKRVLEAISNAEDHLSYAKEALEKEDVDEVENQLDLACERCGDALNASERLKEGT